MSASLHLETPPVSTKAAQPQVFHMTPQPHHLPEDAREWDVNFDGLTEHEAYLRCLKALDRAALQKTCERVKEKPGAPSKPRTGITGKKFDWEVDRDGFGEREVNLRLLKALERNSRVARSGHPPDSSPSSSSSSSSDDLGTTV